MLTRISRQEQKGKSGNYSCQAFIEQYKRYYQLWLDQDGLGSSLRDAQQFANSINKHLRTFNDEDEDLDRTAINHILAGEYIPSLNQLRAMCLEFRMFGDLRDSFIERADASRRERADAEARHYEEIILPSRRTNPGGNVELPSFAEMVEESHRAKLNVYENEDINTLLWDRVFKAWGRNGKDFSPEQFCALIEDNNKGKEGKAGLSNNTIYNWRNHPDKYKCIAVSVKVMSKAFGLAHHNDNAYYK